MIRLFIDVFLQTTKMMMRLMMRMMRMRLMVVVFPRRNERSESRVQVQQMGRK